MFKVKKVFIIGKGSIGLKHFKILKKINKSLVIEISSSRSINFSNKKFIEKLKLFNPDYVIIASPATYHFLHLKILERNLKKKVVLVEKPLFHKNYLLPKKLKNKYFVGYNLRFDPVINYFKNFLKNKDYFHININCSSFLPSWRKNINYKKSVSANKKLGGGVLLELSHEIDYLIWLFGVPKIIRSTSLKISNLKINTDDFFNLIAKKGKTIINLSMNYFSLHKKREIVVDSKDFSLHGDLRNNSIILYKGNRIIKKKLKKKLLEQSIEHQHLSLLKNNFKNICSLKEGQKVIEFIQKIKKNYVKNK